jgi:biotin operon repressor
MARPRKKIDKEQIKKLAQIGCSGDEIASVVGCSRDLIYKRFSTVLKEGHEHRNASIRRQQYALAMKGHPTMLIWLGKQFLGQRDKQEVTGENGGPVQSRILVEFV